MPCMIALICSSWESCSGSDGSAGVGGAGAGGGGAGGGATGRAAASAAGGDGERGSLPPIVVYASVRSIGNVEHENVKGLA